MQRNIWKVFVVASMLACTQANARHFPHHPVNGQCGSANGVPTTSDPTTNLCVAGTATAASGAGPWAWSCVGSNGGTTASCSAPLQQSGGSGSGSGGSSGGSAQVPGPSADLFNAPYYKCVTNYYVSTSGNDSANGQAGTPWRTLQHADDAKVAAGSCINVAAGTYDGVLLHNGGNAANSTGYVVYRCQTLDACIIRGNGGVNGSSAFDFVRTTDGTPPNYVQIDGFEMVGQGTFYPVGVQVFSGNYNSTLVASHHVWVLNSVVHGFGQAGIAMAGAEYFYAIHNTSHGNSNTQCDAQGSGISYNTYHPVAGYTPTADDKANPNSLIGSFVDGSDFFRNVIEWNVTYNNALTQCGTVGNPTNTDGNGIIIDTAGLKSQGNSVDYTRPTLVAFNITYNNGGGGVHIFNSAYVTVANNSCYNNYIDPADKAAWRGCIDSADGIGGTYINNLMLAIPAVASNCQYNVAPYAMWNSAVLSAPAGATDTWSNNITDMIGVGCNGEINAINGDTYSATANQESTNPGWVNVGTISVGTETTPPVGTNFALSPGSKAIGAGLTEPYLPPQSVDVGACSSSLMSCP
jgi:hypothetical protein